MASLAFIPEIEIYNMLLAIFKHIRLDYAANTATPDDSLIHLMFNKDRCGNELNLGNFNWVEQAVEIFVGRGVDSPRRIDVGFGYNQNRNSKPTIHIMLPSETSGGSPIGLNEGYRPAIGIGDKQHAVYTMRSSCTYNLLISSDNSSEVVLIYTALRTMFLSIKTHLELLEYYNVTFGGGDVMLDSDFAPPNIYHRNFTLSFEFPFDGIDLKGKDKILNLNFVGTPIEKLT